MSEKTKGSNLTKTEIGILKRLVPLHTLSEKKVQKLAKALIVRELSKGDLLFREGAMDTSNYYLLVGQVAMISEGKIIEKVSSRDDIARYPLAHQVPRRYTVRAASDVRFIKIDSRVLSKVLGAHNKDYLVNEIDGASNHSADWMSQLLHLRVMQLIPAANIQRVMLSIQQQHVERGQKVISQGDRGDWYYVIAEGVASVRRDSGEGVREVARLNAGDAFGEEALLSNSPRNSTVIMLTDGELMRLERNEFMELIGQPLLHSVNYEEANKRVLEDGAIWLDLRSTDDFAKAHMPEAVNLPYNLLRFQASALASNRHYVLYDDIPGRDVAAAYLLTERGLDVSVLSGGVEALPLQPPQPSKPQEIEIDKQLKARLEETERRLINANEQVETNADHIDNLEDRLSEVQDQYRQLQIESQHQVSALQDEITSLKLELELALSDLSQRQYDLPPDMDSLIKDYERLQQWKSNAVSAISNLIATEKNEKSD